jgi:hypothetical protein
MTGAYTLRAGFIVMTYLLTKQLNSKRLRSIGIVMVTQEVIPGLTSTSGSCNTP